MKTINKETKNLIMMNISTADFSGVPADFGQNEDGKWGFIIDWDNLPDRYIKLIEENLSIIDDLVKTRNERNTILVGDYLEMPDGTESRVTYCHDDGVQDGGGSGSFFLCRSGNGSYSGGLNGIKPLDKITPTDKTKPALFWIFSRNWSGANRGFYFYINVRVWKIESMLKTAYVKFDEWKYNYHTNVNGKLSDEEVKSGFIGKWFNLGTEENEIMRQCNDCAVYY
jgi:hypothetical protein